MQVYVLVREDNYEFSAVYSTRQAAEQAAKAYRCPMSILSRSIEALDINEPKEHSLMLSRIAGWVEDFKVNEGSTTLECVMNLLSKYHWAQSELVNNALEESVAKNSR